jgi:hypothetical protein
MDAGLSFFFWELQSPTFNHGPPDRDGLHGLALELPVASCPPGQGTWLLFDVQGGYSSGAVGSGVPF